MLRSFVGDSLLVMQQWHFWVAQILLVAAHPSSLFMMCTMTVIGVGLHTWEWLALKYVQVILHLHKGYILTPCAHTQNCVKWGVFWWVSFPTKQLVCGTAHQAVTASLGVSWESPSASHGDSPKRMSSLGSKEGLLVSQKDSPGCSFPGSISGFPALHKSRSHANRAHTNGELPVLG